MECTRPIIVPKIDKWYEININQIDELFKSKIRGGCKKLEDQEKAFRVYIKFEDYLEKAKKDPDKYPKKMEVKIFPREDARITEEELCNKDKEGGKIVDEVVANLFLMMRICNDEAIEVLFGKLDNFPYTRFILCDEGRVGSMGGGTNSKIPAKYSPANIRRRNSDPKRECTDTLFVYRKKN